MIKRFVPLAAAVGGAIIAMVCASDAAWAEKRVALVVGNATYQTVPQLPNPSRDATSVAKMFKDAGFDSVDVAINVGNLEFKRAIRKFEVTADQADIAVVYYAGHGLEIGGINYLIPTDARLASDRDADDEAILLERLVSSADGAKRLRLVILDACRDNPFATTMRRERKVSSRGVVAGLGKVEPTSTDTLIAYAAKAGSTADDGDGQHSPFTSAVLRNLTVPGLDVRLAFGRVRDEVLKTTSNRQEPFVYGSLGGGNVSLVPAPSVPQEASVSDVKADYELVQKIGSKRAWEVFLGTHPTGFFADLARAQMDGLANPPQPVQPNVNLASLPKQPAPPARDTPTRESIEWEKVKDTNDPAALQKFIKRFPDSPLSVIAQQRMDVLTNAAQQRADQARAEREAVRRAAEEALRYAEQRKAELAAVKKRDDDERRARALEAEQNAKAAEAERKAAATKLKAEQADKETAAAEAAALRAASEKQAKEAEEARRKAELAAAKEATCMEERGKLDEIAAKGSDRSGLNDLTVFSRSVTCDRLRETVIATLDKFKGESIRRAAAMPNSPELVRSAQTELVRLGCLIGKVDGVLNTPTNDAVTRYLTIEGQSVDKVSVTEALVSELTKHTSRVCPLECKVGETLRGEACIADERSRTPATTSRKNDENDTPARRKQTSRQPEREATRAKIAPEAPRARQQALARPSIVSGGGNHSTMIGVGF